MNEDSKQKDVECNGGGSGVKVRVRSWVNEMRKKSHVTVQKWVDSISVTEDKINCDSNELKVDENIEPSTSSGGASTSVKEKFTEICNKLNVNEKLKCKKSELKNLISKTTHKIKKQSSKDIIEMEEEEQQQQQQNESSDKIDNDDDVKAVEQNDDVIIKSDSITDNNKDSNKHEEIKSDSLNVQKCHISVLGRSSSENPNPRSRRLTDIGRSFSVAHDDENDAELPIDSSENLIYDVDEDLSIAIPSFDTSPSVLSNQTNSNNQLDRNSVTLRHASLGQMRPLREHTVSEGHYSPQVLPKNPLLRDSSFQSDSSHCSSVESLLEARKPDAEAILVNLGFAGVQGSDNLLSKIPKRFLKPSQVRGVDTESFLKNQQLSMNIHENSVLGYRGLIGNTDSAPSDIVRAIMTRFSQNEMRKMASMENISSQRSFKGVANTILAQRHFMQK